MKERTLTTIVFIFSLSFFLQAQNVKQITINLSPVVKENGKYFYDGRRVTFQAVMMPLIAVKDEEINRKLKSLNTMQDVRRIVAIAPMIFILYNISTKPQGSYSNNEILTFILASFAAVITTDIIISSKKRSIINRYNDIILQPTAQVLPHGFAVGASIRF